MSNGLVQILEGNTFVVSDVRGDIEASLTDPTGLFSFDTRFLSRWVLTIDGQRLNALSTDDLQYFETRFFLVPGTGTVYVNAKLSVIRQRAVANGFHETLTILNHDDQRVEMQVRIEAGNDFADLFEVKDALKKKGSYYHRIEDNRLVLGYVRDTYERQSWVSSSTPAAIDEHGLTFALVIEPHGSWTTDLDVIVVLDPSSGRGDHWAVRSGEKGSSHTARGLEKWLQRAPRLECDSDELEGDVPAKSGGPRRPAVCPAHHAQPIPSRGGSPLVHDDVRT